MERNGYRLPDVAAGMTPEELAGACTYIRSSTKNVFAQELSNGPDCSGNTTVPTPTAKPGGSLTRLPPASASN